MRIAVIGAGWAGCAAAVEAVRLGHQVSIFEAARIAGGRARRVEAMLPGYGNVEPTPVTVDNGQHIMIGAYTETLALMADIGVDASAALLRIPLTLRLPEGDGIKLPRWPAPLDALAGIITARGWAWRDKLSLLKTAAGWQLNGFKCAAGDSVADICNTLSPGAMQMLVEPLCVSALNTPASRASGQVFLRVIRDSLFAGNGGSNLLLPRLDLSALLPDAALRWLSEHGAKVHVGSRVQSLSPLRSSWVLGGETMGEGDESNGFHAFDGVILACPPGEAARLALVSGTECGAWIASAQNLQYEAITTVYAHAPEARLREPMLTLHSDAASPAQFVFDRGQLGGPAGLLAFVVSASEGDAATLTGQVLAQGRRHLTLKTLTPVQTVVEKRATFACTPGLQRPGMTVASGLMACGDYVDGPYPATLEGAVRSGLLAARAIH